MSLRRSHCLGLVFLACAGAALGALPAGLHLSQIASGTDQPVALGDPGDGSGRLFVVERNQGLRIIENGQLLATPYLSLDVPTNGEYGVLGIAFDAQFASNGVFYLAFTAPSDEPRLGSGPDNLLARFTASNPAADVFAGTRTDILRIPDASIVHNGGDIHFGPDGMLYWSIGDDSGSWWNSPQDLWKKTQDGAEYYLLGKILRLDVGGTSIATGETCGGVVGSVLQYRIPAGNPLVGSSNTCDEIWHWGLRNPWRFSIDRVTGDMYIGDVGQNNWEEVDRATGGAAGRNFGWSCWEGHVNPGGCTLAGTPTLPVFDYGHNSDGGWAVIGGFVYRGPNAAMQGIYFYGDLTRANVFYAEPASGHWHDDNGITGVPLTTGLNSGMGPTGFGQDRAGNVYVLAGTKVWRIDADMADLIFADGFD